VHLHSSHHRDQGNFLGLEAVYSTPWSHDTDGRWCRVFEHITGYDVTTTATYTPPVSVCIAYDPAQFGDPSILRLFHFENNAWVDVMTSNDTGAHVICGQVSSLSIFVIAQPSGSPLSFVGPANIWVGLKNSDDVRCTGTELSWWGPERWPACREAAAGSTTRGRTRSL
jgi:hypothetical protein